MTSPTRIICRCVFFCFFFEGGRGAAAHLLPTATPACQATLLAPPLQQPARICACPITPPITNQALPLPPCPARARLPRLQTLVPTVVPGIVFGILGLLGFIFFSCWMCTQCCCHRPRLVPTADRAQQQQQFISGDGEPSAPHAAAGGPKPSWRQRRWAQPGFLFKALLAALALTVFAISTWGLVESIQATNDTFSDLWDIVDAVRGKASIGGLYAWHAARWQTLTAGTCWHGVWSVGMAAGWMDGWQAGRLG